MRQKESCRRRTQRPRQSPVKATILFVRCAKFEGAVAALIVTLMLGSAAAPVARAQATQAPAKPGNSQTKPAATGSLSPAEQESYGRAVASYEAGDFASARGPLVTLAGTHPRLAEIQIAAGMALAQGGDVAAALPFLERARRLSPARAEIAANLGVAYLKLERPVDAARELGAAARMEPRNLQTQWSLGQARLDAGDAAGAEQAFAVVRALDPDGREVPRAELVAQQASARWERGDGPGAVALLQAEPSTPTSAAAQSLLGEIAEHGGHYEASLEHLQNAAKLDPSESNIYAVGVELLRHWTFAPAANVLAFGAERYPESRRMRLGLGIAYYGGSEFAKAIPVFRALLLAAPEDSVVADLLGRSCSAQGAGAEGASTDAGCADLTAFAAAHPANAPAALYAAVAMLHRPQGEREPAAAERLLRQAIKADPRQAEAFYEMGALLQERGDWSGSAAMLERAVALRPAYAEAHYRLSRAYAHTGRPEDAKQQIALQQQTSAAEKEALNRRLHEVVTFLPEKR